MSASTSSRWSPAPTREQAAVRLVAQVWPSRQWWVAAGLPGRARPAPDGVAASTGASEGMKAISS